MVVHLSPRSEATWCELAAGTDTGRIHLPNASIVDASDVVLQTMQPPHLEEALRGVAFRRGQVVASCVVGAPLADVEAAYEDQPGAAAPRGRDWEGPP